MAFLDARTHNESHIWFAKKMHGPFSIEEEDGDAASVGHLLNVEEREGIIKLISLRVSKDEASNMEGWKAAVHGYAMLMSIPLPR